MFNAQRLLGQVLQQALGGGLGGRKRRRGGLTGLPSGMEAKLGMGLLGLAIAAVEHFRQAPTTAPQGLAGATGTPPPPPPPGRPTADAADQARSLLLLRLMICAIHADGAVDANERSRLLDRARAAGLGAEDLDALEDELWHPRPLPELLGQLTPDLHEPAYAAAFLAIDADHPDEHQFLAALADGLGLDAARQARLRAQLQPPPPPA